MLAVKSRELGKKGLPVRGKRERPSAVPGIERVLGRPSLSILHLSLMLLPRLRKLAEIPLDPRDKDSTRNRRSPKLETQPWLLHPV